MIFARIVVKNASPKFAFVTLAGGEIIEDVVPYEFIDHGEAAHYCSANCLEKFLLRIEVYK